MKNKYYTYINTSDEKKHINITVKIAGQVINQGLTLEPGEILNEAKAKIVFGTNVESIEDIEVAGSDGKYRSIRPQALNTPEDILKHSAILDIETGGLRAGSPITQIAVTDLASQKSNLFIPKPNLVLTPTSIEQGMSFLQKIAATQADIPEDMNFRELKYLETYFDMNGLSAEERAARFRSPAQLSAARMAIQTPTQRASIEDYMMRNDKFQAALYIEDEDKLKKAGISPDVEKRKIVGKILSGEKLDLNELTDYLRQNQGTLSIQGHTIDITQDRQMRDIISSDLPDLLKGKVTWVANTSFESSQFAAQVKAEATRSMEAFNAARSASGLEPLDEKTFMTAFNKGQLRRGIDALGDPSLISRNPFVDVTGVNPLTGRPFDMSGQGDFARVRAEAMKTGDFSGLYEALLRDTSAGDVRDIQDLSRSLQSKLKNFGILDIERPAALSVEIQARLALGMREMRLMEEAGEELDIGRVLNTIMNAKETHVAIGDTLLSESPLLTESFDMLESLRKFELGGAEADDLLKQARAGKGGLYRAFVLGGLQDLFNKEGLDDVLFRQRMGRMLDDIATQGYTELRRAKPGMGGKQSALEVMDGLTQVRTQHSPQYNYIRTRNLEDIISELENLTDYKSANKAQHIAEMRQQVGQYFDNQGNLIDTKAAQVSNYAKPLKESASDQIFAIRSAIQDSAGGFRVDQNFFDALKSFSGIQGAATGRAISVSSSVPTTISSQSVISSPVGSGSSNTAGAALSKNNTNTAAVLADKFKAQPDIPSFRGSLGKGLVGAAVIGYAFKAIDSLQTKPKENSYILPDYGQFLENQSKFYGSEQAFIEQMQQRYGTKLDSLQEQGIMASMRKHFTDFGSPYQGMGYTLSVLDDNRLRRERQKYEQAQFGSRHFSVDGDVGFQLRRYIDSAFKQSIGTAIKSDIFFGNYNKIDSQKYNSLKGDDLIEYKFNPADISIEDADTITVHRAGATANALSSFMGVSGQQSMKFRLAGIDAPETAHGDRAAQPYAEAAKRMAIDIISKGKDIRIVSRPGDHTYGRQVGMVYVDGKNLNLELVRRGAAAYLPYKGKDGSQFYNQKAFEDAQTFAQDSQRGMWRSAYFQAYKLITRESGQTVTFNTLVNPEKVAKNASLMSMASMMNQADQMGFINTSMSLELSQLGQQQKMASQKSGQNVFAPDEIYNAWMGPELSTYGQPENSILPILDQMKYEIGRLYRTKGSKVHSETAKVNRVARDNIGLANDAISSANETWNSEKSSRIRDVQKSINTKIRRLKAMEELQHQALGNLFNSPIGHHRM